MSSNDEFMEYCIKILDDNFGYQSKRIIDRARSKKNLNDASNIHDFEEFINLIELNISVLSGKNNAVNICNSIRSKAIELNISKQAMDIYNALRTESSELSIGEFLRKINVMDVWAFRTKATGTAEKQKLEFSMNNKIDDFLMKHTLPTESDIKRYSAYLSLKFCEDVKKIKIGIIEKVKIRVKNELIGKAIQEEIKNFLTRYPEPAPNDIDDFVNHIHLSNLNFQDDELRQQIEDEMLYGKFYESQDREESQELAQFFEIIKTHNDQKDISAEMQRQGIIYLIEDESGVSDKLLDEYVELITPFGNREV